jgi:WD40 repeat protein
LKKIVLTGEVLYKEMKRNFIMIYSLESSQAEIIKIIDVEAEITCINYGPYDNGHILVGLSDGRLIAFDYLTLERLESVVVFENQAITTITFDPTNYIFVGGANGKMICLSYIDKKMHYLYLDLGKSKYCTIQMPRSVTPNM